MEAPQADEFAMLEARLRQGDESASKQVFERFANRLIGLARKHIDRRLRGKVEPDDVLQSVFRSFFVRQRAGKFQLKNWDDTWSLLVVITVRKCGRQVARYSAESRDVNRDRPLLTTPFAEEIKGIARDPTPLEAAALAELVEELMNNLSGVEREVLALRLQGHTVSEISVRINRTERTVSRLLRNIRQQVIRSWGE